MHEKVRRLAACGLSRVTISLRLGISRQTVWRVLSQYKAESL
jgi:DNA invertase Pin-like site-specific DNA recombinase